MSSYLRSWFSLDTATAAPPQAKALDASDAPILEVSSPHASDDEEDGEETETEDDNPPAFPALGSAQRASSSIPRILTDSQLMPPPPAPRLANRQPGTSSLTASLSIPSSTSSSLAPPTTTTKRPAKPSKKRDKVVLAPGHSPLDWASLKSSGTDLRVSLIGCFF